MESVPNEEHQILLSSQSKGKKDKIMTKKEMATMEEMLNTIKALNKRIEKLENSKMVSRTNTVESKESKTKSKNSPVVVGNLIFDGKYVKTGEIKNSTVRYAIMKTITEKFNGTKLTKGNPIYDKCAKEDKYVQVYEFKTIADCKKFMEEQHKRVG